MDKVLFEKYMHFFKSTQFYSYTGYAKRNAASAALMNFEAFLTLAMPTATLLALFSDV